MTNPLLEPWNGVHGLPHFDRIASADFAPAFEQALAEGRAALAGIADDPAPPSFENTIAALERMSPLLDRVSALFFHLASSHTDAELQALERDLAPKLAAYSAEITLNAALFARVASLWQAHATLGLSPEATRVLDLYHRMFTRAGAGLSGPARARMTEIRSRLAVLSTQFSQNLLADERDTFLPLAAEDMAGLPESLCDGARGAAQERGHEGQGLSLSRSLIVPFLQSSPRRDLRERAYLAFEARGAGGGATDNRAIAAEILALRQERAALLGYPNFAAYMLDAEMAKTPERVRDLLMVVWRPARAKALTDSARYEAMLHADGINGALEPWDWRYYAERQQRIEHDLDEAALKPYLRLEAMIEAAFAVAKRLFGLEFRPIDAALYHPDARAWQVTRQGRDIAVFIGDYFARPSKRSGAWCSALRKQSRLDGEVLPIVLNICNFTRTDPALLGWDDARTLFHEFGHALHQMLSNVTFPFISGTSVARDFVELPSQLFEHWLEVPEVLETHARHWKTGEPMPPDLARNRRAAANHDQSFASVEFLASALVDLGFHEGAPPADPMARQAEILAGLQLPHAIRMRHAMPHFAHVFSGDGYSARYYSYMWSEVMDADAFAAFEEAGDPFDPDTAERLERTILSTGGSQEPEALYLAFRGRMPGVEALLKGRGLLPEAG